MMQVIVICAGALYVMTQTTMTWSKNYQFFSLLEWSNFARKLVGWWGGKKDK